MAKQRGAPGNNIKVLHVDDDEYQLEMMRLFFESTDQPIDVTSVNNPYRVLDILREKVFDCVVSDFKMPEMTGLELAEKIRGQSDVPIILYTGQGSEEVAEAAFNIGVNDYIRKEIQPSHYQVLAKRIIDSAEKKRTEELYHRVVEDTSDAISIVVDGKIILANRAQSELLGVRASSDIVDSQIYDWIAVEDQKRVFNHMEDCARTGAPQVFEFTAITRGNEEKTIEVSTTLLDHNGEKAILSFSRDITERRRIEKDLKKSEERFRNLVTLAPDGVCTLTPSGVVTFVNPSFEKITGYSASEFVGKHLLNIATMKNSNPIENIRLFLEIARGKDIGTKEFTYVHRDGTPRWAEARINMYKTPDNKPEIIGVLRDITERKKAEKKPTRQLEELIEKRAAELAAVNRQESKEGQASLSELRSQLNALRNTLYIIKENPERASEMMRLAENVIENSINLLGGGGGPQESSGRSGEPSNLNDIINESLSKLDASKKVEIQVDLDQDISATRNLAGVEKALKALLEKCLLELDPGGCLRITTRRHDYTVEITVQGTQPRWLVVGGGARPKGQVNLNESIELSWANCRKMIEECRGRIAVSRPRNGETVYVIQIPL